MLTLIRKKEMTFLEHLSDLRKKLLITFLFFSVFFLLSYFYYLKLVDILFVPFSILQSDSGENVLFAASLFEGFFTRLKISLLGAGILTAPIAALQIIAFIFPALIKKEKVMILTALTVSSILGILSVLYGYAFILPFAVKFLSSASFYPENAGRLLNFQGNIFFAFQISFVSAIAFQLPLVLELLMYAGLVTRRFLLSSSHYFIVLIFMFSAVLTPPDILTQTMIAIPLIALYFLSIAIAKLLKIGGGE